MPYVTPTTRATGYVVLATDWNLFVENFTQMAPDLFTANGDIYVASGANVGVKLAAFTSSTGALKHENGGLESNISSGDGLVQVKAGATTVIKSNIAASSNPGTGDDTGDGYAIGSFWLNTTADRPWVCLDASSGAAVWKEMSGITHIVEDTTPQLGGTLDIQTNAIAGNGGTVGITIDSVGAVNMAGQPAFSAFRTTSDLNVTGDGSNFPVVMDSEEFDQGVDYDLTTFMAPIAGRYRLSGSVGLAGVTDHTDGRLQIVTNGQIYRMSAVPNTIENQSTARAVMTIAVFADMGNGDTAVLKCQVGGGSAAKVVDIGGDSANASTHFSGELVA